MSGFRRTFDVMDKRALNWFPKHMNTGLKQMQAKLRSVDCIVEVHDARIPFSGRNPNFAQRVVGNKPIIVVLNKTDLISKDSMNMIRGIYDRTNNRNLIFTCSKDDQDRGIKKIMPMLKDIIETSDRFHRSGSKEYHAMIIGIPNVGKSSLINILRSKNMKKGRAVKVGPSAGVTKSVHEKVKISENPLIYLFDTPGILTPSFSNPITGLKLAVCGNLPDHQVGEETIADYILYTLNQMGNYKYMEHMGLEEPCDCITTVLAKGSIKLNYMIPLKQANQTTVNKPDLKRTAKEFILSFRKAEYGKVLVDNLNDGARFENSFRNIGTNFTDNFETESGIVLANANEKFSNFS